MQAKVQIIRDDGTVLIQVWLSALDEGYWVAGLNQELVDPVRRLVLNGFTFVPSVQEIPHVPPA